jgi:hypothetical protein
MREMKKIINSIALTFVIIFTMTISIYTAIEALVFEKRNLDFFFILMVVVVTFAISIILTFFLRNNHTTMFLQITITYMMLAAMILFLAFYRQWFTISRPEEIIPAWFFIGIGYIILIWFLTMRRQLELKKINRKLNEFKERKK